MLETINRTDWAVQSTTGWDINRQPAAVIVVRASYQIDHSGALTPRPAEIEPADRHYGATHATSLAAATDGMAFKQGADCLVHGTVHPFEAGAPAREVRVTVTTAHERIDKRLRVAGRRYWQKTPVGLVPSNPEPLQATPLCYEYAFGGVDTRARELEPRNPVGMGFSARPGGAKGAELPRIEYPDDTLTHWSKRPRPAGLGPIAPGWEPRRALTDELDIDALNEGRCPYPQNVPRPIHNVAPPDQRLDQPITGGERIDIEGVGIADREAITVELPMLAPVACVVDRQSTKPLPMTCDTLIVDADAGTLDQVWRGTVIDGPNDRKQRWAIIAAPSEEAA